MKAKLFNLLSLLAHQEQDSKPHTVYLLTSDRIEHISERLTEHMVQQRPFLKTGYSIRNLSDEISIPTYQLSAYLNRQKGLNFNDYLNQFRVRHCEDVFRSGNDRVLNLKGIASTCGFSNRNTFTKAFKKFTGYTPSEYRRQCFDSYQHSLLKPEAITGTF